VVPPPIETSRTMADPNLFDPIRIPFEVLAEVDWRPYHFAMQRYHYLVRTAHIASMAAFFGGIGMLDFRLMGWRGTVPLRALAEHVLPWLWVTFAMAMATGMALFLYDPVHVGAHAYWSPKLIAIGLGLVNAALFHRGGYVAALAALDKMPASARIAGLLSLTCWTAALAFACLDTEAAPKIFLR
jgi:hypothetical protein